MGNRPLLYIDYLGFSKLVLASNLKSLYQLYNEMVARIILATDITKHEVKYDLVSDSLFVWSEDSDVQIATELLIQIGIRAFYPLFIKSNKKSHANGKHFSRI